MKKLIAAAVFSFAAVALLATAPAEAAKRKNSKAPAKSYASTYYYQGSGTHTLRDRARPYFGSPVRGKEFFEAQGAGQ